MPRKKRQPDGSLFDSLADGSAAPDSSAPPDAPSTPEISASLSTSESAERSKDLPADDAQKRSKTQADTANSVSVGPSDLVVLIDSHSLLYQLFHAMPTMTAPDGSEVGTIHGFFRDLIDLRQRHHPNYLICCFDVGEKTFRHDLYDQYKANRTPMPPSLNVQIKRIKGYLSALGVQSLGVEGYEADDLLATLATQAADAGARVLLVTSDKDCRQLLSDRIAMLNLRKQQMYGVDELARDWGVRPDQVVDFQSLVGDSVDNVPGVRGIGPKAARELLNAFDTLEGIYENVDAVTAKARRAALIEHRESAFSSRRLVELDRSVPIEWDWRSGRDRSPSYVEVEPILAELGFRQLGERILQSAAGGSSGASQSTIDRAGYRCIDSADLLMELSGQLAALADQKSPLLAIDTETTSTDPMRADLVGISLACELTGACYIPVRAPESQRGCCHTLAAVQAALRPALTSPTITKAAQNLKYDWIVFRRHGIPLDGPLFDTMVADYLCNPGERNHSLDELARRYLSHQMIPITDLIGTGKDQRTFDQVDLADATRYAAEDADATLQLVPIMQRRLEQLELTGVFADLEMPLIAVLVDMEMAGIAVDSDRLGELGVKFEERIAELRGRIASIAGEELNPDSPKQLSAMLFDTLKLPVVKRTKSGPSTDVEVLQELSGIHPLPALIIEYRQVSKLKSTYIDALPKLIHPETGRIHTSFRQDVAATGRLSSSEPNLQNIPIRTEDGRRIRSAFLAAKDDWILLAADYSQIELRMMAHFSGDETLRSAFLRGDDVHAAVAAQTTGVPLADVTRDMRRAAKATNFGILYGQSPFGLAKTLGIPKDEAATFIDAYFANFRGVRDFIARTLMSARRDGYVSTMSGRRRYLRGIRDFEQLSPNQQKTLLEPERMAVNAVIQGSAADLIKVAMIHVREKLAQRQLPTRLLLQIHDELLLEVHRDAAGEVGSLVRDEMIGAAQLSVPLVVDLKQGHTWADL